MYLINQLILEIVYVMGIIFWVVCVYIYLLEKEVGKKLLGNYITISMLVRVLSKELIWI